MSRGAKIIPASAGAAKGAAGGSRWGGETAPKILIFFFFFGIVLEEEGTLPHPGGMRGHLEVVPVCAHPARWVWEFLPAFIQFFF